MINLVLLAWLLSWDFCPGENVTYITEVVHVRIVGSVVQFDQDGNPVDMPIYSTWVPQPVSEGPALQAEIPCEPEMGEVCVGIVTAVDEAGNRDDGRECE